MSKAFRIVKYECTGCGVTRAYALLRERTRIHRARCGCYAGAELDFCDEDFESITGISLPVGRPALFRLVRVDEPRPGWLRRLFDWLFWRAPA